MSGSSSASEIGKQENGMPEPRLKQARLPFKTTTIKRSAPETGKKRKHEDDSANAADKVSRPVYIDITETNEVSTTSQLNSSDDVDVKSTKVCIIQGKPKEGKPKSESIAIEDNLESEQVDVASRAAENTTTEDSSKRNEKRTSLQKWFKPKKAEVTSTNNDKPSNIDANERKSSTEMKSESSAVVENIDNEPMEIDRPEDSAPSTEQPLPDESKKCNSQDSNSNEPLLDESADGSLNGSIDASSADISAPTTPNSSVALKKKLTPKQRHRREEMALRRQEKERQKQEKEKKRLEEKEEKQRLKEEKEKKRLAEIEAKNEEKRQKEEERKAKEEEKKRQKEEERKQKEEERKQKEEERKQKEEEKRQKEEERKQKEEEKRLKEEQKRQKEEHERKLKEKTAAVFTNFFLPKTKDQQKEASENVEKMSHTMFMPFEVKANMKLASIVRVTVDREKLRSLDEALQNGQDMDKDSLYLAPLKSKNYKPGHSENTWPLNTAEAEDEDDVMIVDDTSSTADSLAVPEKPMRYRCKLLQFHDNKRPAYWGTWRKPSKKITGRTPFKQEEIFDYEMDSDEEWEDEPGESVDGSDDEKEPEDDYEVDNDVFVPHGYLSDEEAQNDDALDSSPKSNKLKLNVLERQFEEEMKEKTHKLKPRVFGCIWINNSVKKDEGATSIENLLLAFRAVHDDRRTPFVIPSCSNEVTPQSTPSVKTKLKHEFPDSFLPHLVKLAHGSGKNSKVLAKEFNAYVLSKDPTLNLTLSCITKKLKEISAWVSNLSCRLVSEEIRNQCGMPDLPHTENTWKYITVCEEPAAEKIQKSDADKQPVTLAPSNPSLLPSSNQSQKIKANVPSIAKFVKVLTAEEKQMAFNEMAPDKSAEKQTISSPSSKPKNKPKTGITKFMKVLDSRDKNVNNKPSETVKCHKSVISIDLTNENSAEMKFTSGFPTPSRSVLEPPTLVNGSDREIKPSNDNVHVKPANILIPRKSDKNPAVNILIPRKTPSRPITSPISARPFAALAQPKPEAPFVTALVPENVKDVPKNVINQSKPVNVLIPRRAKDLRKSDDNANSKPVNILIPRKAADAQNIEKKVESSPRSKPINILIPRRAKDVPRKSDENIPYKAKCDSVDKPKDELVVEKAKDFVEDNASSDFSLSIESGDTSDMK